MSQGHRGRFWLWWIIKNDNRNINNSNEREIFVENVSEIWKEWFVGVALIMHIHRSLSVWVCLYLGSTKNEDERSKSRNDWSLWALPGMPNRLNITFTIIYLFDCLNTLTQTINS